MNQYQSEYRTKIQLMYNSFKNQLDKMNQQKEEISKDKTQLKYYLYKEYVFKMQRIKYVLEFLDWIHNNTSDPAKCFSGLLKVYHDLMKSQDNDTDDPEKPFNTYAIYLSSKNKKGQEYILNYLNKFKHSQNYNYKDTEQFEKDICQITYILLGQFIKSREHYKDFLHQIPLQDEK